MQQISAIDWETMLNTADTRAVTRPWQVPADCCQQQTCCLNMHGKPSRSIISKCTYHFLRHSRPRRLWRSGECHLNKHRTWLQLCCICLPQPLLMQAAVHSMSVCQKLGNDLCSALCSKVLSRLLPVEHGVLLTVLVRCYRWKA